MKNRSIWKTFSIVGTFGADFWTVLIIYSNYLLLLYYKWIYMAFPGALSRNWRVWLAYAKPTVSHRAGANWFLNSSFNCIHMSQLQHGGNVHCIKVWIYKVNKCATSRSFSLLLFPQGEMGSIMKLHLTHSFHSSGALILPSPVFQTQKHGIYKGSLVKYIPFSFNRNSVP